MSVVLCNDQECLFFRPLDEPEELPHKDDYVAFEDTKFLGKCERQVIGMRPKRIETALAAYNLMDCVSRSDIKISGHRDFTTLGPHFVDEAGIRDHERDKKRSQF